MNFYNESIKFCNIKIEKFKFYYSKYPVNISNLHIDKIILYDKISFGKNGFKYFIGYKDDNKVEQLCVMSTKIIRLQETMMIKLNICLFDRKRWIDGKLL